jgi:starch synthase
MYSQRYGTLPLVRATGGLDDTVENYDPSTGMGTGFKFADAHAGALLNTLRWALSIYEDKAAWRRMQVAGMRKDFSWHGAAGKYVDVYRRALAARSPEASV